MKLTIHSLLSLCLIAGLAVGQQPNSFTSSMAINGQAGPPYPITGVQMPRGLSQNVTITGVANAPFVTYASQSLASVGFSTAFGLVDLNLLAGGLELFNGLNNVVYRTDSTGIWTQNIGLPGNATIGSTAAVQTLVANNTVPSGASLTAASELIVIQGLTVVNITFAGAEPGRPGTLFSFTPYQMTFPFYDATWTRMWINSDGHCSFSGNVSDFTPTPGEFRTGPSRAAPFWTDLDPGYGAQVTATVDQSPLNPFPTVRVDWINMREWSNSGTQHTFAMTLNMVTGDIEMWHSPFNGAMVYDQFMGIGPGQNRLPPSPNNQWSAQKDLSVLPINPILGLPNEAFWEWYGLTGGQMPYYTAGFSNPWDMAGTTTNFIALNNSGSVGTTGTFYYGT